MGQAAKRGGGRARAPVPLAERGVLPGRLRLTMENAAWALDTCKSEIWELVESGELIAVGKGRGRRIDAASVRAYHQRTVEAELQERGREASPGGSAS